MTQSLGATIDNLYAACVTLYASTTGSDGQPVLVSLGNPGQYQPNAIVAIATEIRSPITQPTMGTPRSRATVAEIDVVMSVFVPGGEDEQIVAFDAAFALQAQLETFLRTSPNERLSGACRNSFVSGSRCVPVTTYQKSDDPNRDPVPIGRVAQNTVTVSVEIRY
jgi:hypothetical protein